MYGIPISVNPPTGSFPTVAFPSFPTCPASSYGNTVPPGCISGNPIPYPNYTGIPAWIVSCVLSLLEWLVSAILFAVNWLIYLMVAGLVGLVSLFVNGLLSVVAAYFNAGTVLANYTGPFAPVTAVLFVAGFVLATVTVVLYGADFAGKQLARLAEDAEGPSSGSGSDSGSSSGSDEEMEEVAEVAA